jgi:hypothetical protein
VPVVSHEIGQWCVYPNFDEMRKYTGHLKPRNFEIFRDRLRANHMGNQARDFLYASGRLQTLCYKEDIESALRTPGMGGFQLLDLHDFPGQGTALVGVLDPFWESKGYVEPEEFRRFCGKTVPLARLERRVFTNRDTLTPISKWPTWARVRWSVPPPRGNWSPIPAGWWKAACFRRGTFRSATGSRSAASRWTCEPFPSPARYRLVVELEHARERLGYLGLSEYRRNPRRPRMCW